jgi:ABC-type Na+ efflux pump permease subunit
MSLEPFLRRELVTSVRSSRAFGDRRNALLLTSLVALGSFWGWDQLGWDRVSVDGAARFGLASFGLAIATLAILGLPMVIPQVARTIASERDQRSLDALLTSRFSSLEIVLGAMLGGLFRYANALASALPILVLLMVLGGLGWGWLALAGLGLASTALLMAAFSVLVSVLAKSGAKAVNAASGMFLLWVGAPSTCVILKPLVWPGAPPWLSGLIQPLVDASPAGFLLNLAGLMPRPGGPVEAVVRLASWEVLGASVLVAWAVARLRPIVRRQQEKQKASNDLGIFRKWLVEPTNRPACGDDPVLWNEMHSTGGVSPGLRLLSQAVSLVMLLGLAMGLWWFAEPAFNELAARGYGPSVEAFTMPRLDPIARLLVNKTQTFSKSIINASPGQARLEFNIVLRQISALFLMGFIAVAFGTALETLKGEQRRDTWLTLISTPLTGWEILKGKIGGTIWKIRDGAFTLLGLWTIGLISGAVHPLGFLLATALLAATGAFFIAQGQAMALFGIHPDRAGKPAIAPVLAPVLILASGVLVAAPMMLIWASLFTYEDFAAILDGHHFPQFSDGNLADAMGARAVLAACLSGTTVLTLGATLLMHTNARSFDESIGRPTSPRFRSLASATAALRARAVCDAVPNT